MERCGSQRSYFRRPESAVSSLRTRLVVLNQYYWPGLEATAYLLSQLCAALAEDYDVTVVTGRLSIPAAPPGREVHEGVRIVRVRSTAFDRSRLLPRAVN